MDIINTKILLLDPTARLHKYGAVLTGAGEYFTIVNREVRPLTLHPVLTMTNGKVWFSSAEAAYDAFKRRLPIYLKGSGRGTGQPAAPA